MPNESHELRSDRITPAAVCAAEPGLRARGFRGVLVTHRTLIGGVALAVVAATAVVTFTMDRLYTAAATIQIEPPAPAAGQAQPAADVSAGGGAYDYYRTQHAILAGRPVAARVIAALELDRDPRFAGSGGWLEQIPDLLLASRSGSRGMAAATELGVEARSIDRYTGMLSVDPVPNSRLVTVRFVSKDPDLSAAAANQHVDEYVNASLAQRLDMTRMARQLVAKELATAKDRVDAAEASLTVFRKTHGIISVDGGRTDVVSQRLDDLNQRLTAAQAERMSLEGRYQLTQQRDRASLPEVLASKVVQSIKEQLAQVEGQRAQLSGRFGPGYQQMAELLARKRELTARLDAEVAAIVSGIESAYLEARTREADLRREFETQRQTAMAQKDVSADYDVLLRDVEVARTGYAGLLEQLKDLGVAEGFRTTTVTVVERATVPRGASSPRPLLNLSVAAGLGILLGLGLACVVEYFGLTLKTAPRTAHRLAVSAAWIVCWFALAVGLAACGPARRAPTPEELRGFGCLAEANSARAGALLAARQQPDKAISDYAVSPGDLIGVTIYNYRPEGGDFVSEVRVDDQGDISLPMLKPFSVRGLSLAEVRREISIQLRRAEVLNNPLVSVHVKEYQGQPVVVLGAVDKPGMYYLSRGSQSVIDLVSLAGGLTERAGNSVLLGEGSKIDQNKVALVGVLGATSPGGEDSPLARDPDMIQLCFDTPAGEPSPLTLTFPVRGGDVIMVPDAGKTFVEGEVDKPGPYPLVRGMTLSQAISSAGGTIFPAKTGHVRVIRTAAPGRTVEWEFDLDSIRERTQPDFRLERNDRVIVPYTLGRKIAYGVYYTVTTLVRFSTGAML